MKTENEKLEKEAKECRQKLNELDQDVSGPMPWESDQELVKYLSH